MTNLLFHALSGLAFLQAPQAGIAGTVRDANTHAAIAGAAVALSDLSRVTAAGADGRYALTDVPPGPQHVTVRFIGYEPRVLHALVPNGGTLEINLTLRPVPIRLRTIEVRPKVAVRGLEGDDTPYPDRSTSMAAVRSHPLLAEPDALVALGGGEVVLSAESPGGLHVRGGGTDQVAYLLDGVPILNPYHSAGLSSAWNPDALARITLTSSGPPGGDWAALSGTVAARTRVAGPRVDVQGGLSTSHGRLTVAGPLGRTGAAVLLSVRSGFPGGIGGESDPSILRGETADRLATLELPALGGRIKLLAYDNENELSALAVAGGERGPDALVRNRFAWHGRSIGAEWKGERKGVAVRVAGWNAAADSEVDWLARSGPLAMASGRDDVGALAAVEHRSASARTELGLRVERSRARYRIEPDSAAVPYSMHSGTSVASLFTRHAGTIGRRVEVDFGASMTIDGDTPRLDPGAQVRWRLLEGLTVSGSFARRHQFTQSLRNPESIVGSIFPADLPIGSDAEGVPVARSDQAIIAAELRPAPGMRVGAQAYVRTFHGLLLAAPHAGEPFTTASFAVGTGGARGWSLEASKTSARYALVASYGFQRVRLGDAALQYVPASGSAHLLDAGVVLFPSATFAVRLGGNAAFGRRGTAIPDAVEWEACNLRDRGCELAGSPHYDGAALGGTRLPAYVRLDLGIRKHWHVEFAGRDAILGLFGTVTNLLGRRNVLTYAGDPADGAATPVEMRPLAPLVLGLDWQF